MATITSVGSGLWSAAGTWDAGVPVDNDAVVIAAGHVVEFDVDTSGFANGIAGLAIAGTLTVSTTTSSYLKIKTSTNISGAGTYNIGASDGARIPYAIRHTTILAGGNNRIDGSSGMTLKVYGTPPTNQYALTTGAEAAGQTRIEIDRNLTTDHWAIGDTVHICNINGYDREVRVIGDIQSGYIDITAGLTKAKDVGSYVVLATRNVGLRSGSTYNIFYNFKDGKLVLDGCSVYSFASSGGANLMAVMNNTIQISGSPVGAVSTGSYFVANSVFISLATLATYAPIHSSDYVNLYNCLLIGSKCSIYNVDTLVINDCNFIGNDYAMNYCRNISIFNSSSINNTYFMSACSGKLFNVDIMGGTSEHTSYSTIVSDTVNCQSEDHNGVDGALKAWCKGGTITSQTTTKPTGYTQAYQHALASASYPAFWYKQFSVEPGKTVSIEVQLRKDASMTYLPRVYLMASIGNPLVVSTPVDTFTMTDSTDTWETDTFTIVNSTNYDQDYTLWFVAKNATGNAYSAYEITTEGGTGGGSVKILPYSGKVGLA